MSQTGASESSLNTKDAVPLLRAYSPSGTDHFNTTNANEMKITVQRTLDRTPSIMSQTAASASSLNTKDAVPLLRAYSSSGTDHFYTTNANEMKIAVQSLGFSEEAAPGRVFPSHIRDTELVPLYRMYQPSSIDHFYTTNASERHNAIARLGYTDEGVVGYVFPYQAYGSIPLYRVYSASDTDHFYTQDITEKNNAVQRLGYSDEGIAAYILPY